MKQGDNVELEGEPAPAASIARDLPTILHRVQSEQSEHFVNVFLRSLKA